MNRVKNGFPIFGPATTGWPLQDRPIPVSVHAITGRMYPAASLVRPLRARMGFFDVAVNQRYRARPTSFRTSPKRADPRLRLSWRKRDRYLAVARERRCFYPRGATRLRRVPRQPRLTASAVYIQSLRVGATFL